MLSPIFLFRRIFGTSYCTIFCTRTVLGSSVYCNPLKPHSYLRVLSTNDRIWVHTHTVLESFETAPTLISKL